jgi:hypothetical protein
VDLVARNFVAGHRVGVLDAGQARIGDLICFEVAYDNLVRDTVRAGAQLIVVQTNNATFGYTDESVQQLAMSRVRAVESGRGRRPRLDRRSERADPPGRLRDPADRAVPDRRPAGPPAADPAAHARHPGR